MRSLAPTIDKCRNINALGPMCHRGTVGFCGHGPQGLHRQTSNQSSEQAHEGEKLWFACSWSPAAACRSLTATYPGPRRVVAHLHAVAHGEAALLRRHRLSRRRVGLGPKEARPARLAAMVAVGVYICAVSADGRRSPVAPLAVLDALIDSCFRVQIPRDGRYGS